jgi:selenocysteine lyase/cysteine desulfurase
MTEQPRLALSILAQMRAQSRAARDALDGLTLAADALEATLQEGMEGPFNGVFNAPSINLTRPTIRSKIDADSELEELIRARVITMTFAQVTAAVTANFPPERRVTLSSIQRWWHRRGKKAGPSIRQIPGIGSSSRINGSVVKPFGLLWSGLIGHNTGPWWVAFPITARQAWAACLGGSMALDLDFVRAQFPAFDSPVLSSHAFFENAGGSYPCAQVIDRLTRFYTHRKVQPYAPYPGSELGGAEMDEARTRLAAMMNVHREEVSFGPSTSANTYVLAQAVRGWLRDAGAAIVVTNQDHESNSGVWRRLAEDGVEVREWQIDPQTGSLDPADLAVLLADGRVRLVAFPHCSNVVAEINDVAAISAMARAAGARTVVDGVSYAPHGFPDVAGLGCDVYLFSAYKTFGPHQGIMILRRDFGMEMPGQAHFFNQGVLYKRHTPAGPDHAQVAACAGMADYIDALADRHGFVGNPATRNRMVHDAMRAAEVAVIAPLMDYLAGRNDLRLIGPRSAEARAPTIAVALDRPALPVAQALGRDGIACGGGDFYAVRPLAAMGVDPACGVLRMSASHYTSAGDVARLIAALDRAL